MIIANSSSMLRSQIARLQMLGKHEEAMTVLQRFLELEREAHASALNTADNVDEPKGAIIAFPRLRPVS